ncbi:hypothetical protein M422DRAFT_251086 [Sphaerobolus stellatus SS14]|uniref:P-type ATPase N-terminal domain-containing protein n=1 Tax=Sphaerobolus stellatus (strain SS14) TaxID=990650 RepID=A0A0C9UQY5_SPHS4|nr:hypothetical protein M422DRAFT_251086 [Sphaerobolus stellatus SS14]
MLPLNINQRIPPFCRIQQPGWNAFDDDDDLEMTTPATGTPGGLRGHTIAKGDLLSPDISPESAFGSSYKAMQSTESGLPLSKNAASPSETGVPRGWDLDDDNLTLLTFEGGGSFPGSNPSRARTPTKRPRRQWRWPWRKEMERTGERGEQVIALNDEQANLAEAYCSNYVSTSKYNVATFLPKFLTGNNSLNTPNVFFFFTTAIQQIPGVSPTNNYTTILPLGLVLLASAFKETQEDPQATSIR